MSTRYLVTVSLAMIVASVIGLAVFYGLRSGLPPAIDYRWPDSAGDVAAQRKAIAEYRTHATASARFLAGAEASSRFDRVEPSSDPTQVEFHESYATRSFFESAQSHATVAIVLFYILLVCGLLGLLRLRVRHMVLASNTILVLALLGGGAMLFFTGAPTIAAIIVTLLLLGFFGQLVGANLLPGADHPMVVAVEDEMRAMSAGQRGAHIAKRIIGGLALLVLGAGFTALSLAISPHVTVVATGAIVGGLFMMTMPLIATIRLRVNRS